MALEVLEEVRRKEKEAEDIITKALKTKELTIKNALKEVESIHQKTKEKIKKMEEETEKDTE